MEAILVKVEDDYRLLNQNNSIIGTTDYEYQKAFSDVCKKLSLKNCQAIENGYDLDELIKEELISVNTKVHRDLERDGWIQIGLVRGFQKALEILGDKKFSEDDILIAMICMQGQEVFYEKTFEETQETRKLYIENYIQSLQRAEWDVKVVMCCGLPDGCTEPEEQCPSHCKIVPLLDEDDCLILRRK